MRAQSVPASQHREEVFGKRRAEDRVGLVDRDHAGAVEGLQDVPLDIARAILRVRVAGVPFLPDRVWQLELLGNRRGKAAEEQRGISFRGLIDQLKVEQRDTLALIESRFD